MEQLSIDGQALTIFSLGGLLVAPTLQYLKKHVKVFEEIPLVKFLIAGVLSYGVAVLYVGIAFGNWEFANQQIIEGTIITSLAAIGVNTTRKTVKKIKEKKK